ncbi:hypothetical protein A3N60_04065 [Klebsiella aerogenes]|nr:hypothetical protein A3N60_04065 [Klebsiella aerogenes]
MRWPISCSARCKDHAGQAAIGLAAAIHNAAAISHLRMFPSLFYLAASCAKDRSRGDRQIITLRATFQNLRMVAATA